MIINTVILFLRDLLPVFILFSYLSALLENKRFEYKCLLGNVWIMSLILGTIFSFIFAFTAQYIADWYNGAGLEIIRTALLLLMFFCFIIAINMISKKDNVNKNTGLIIIVGCSLFVIEKGSSFLIFFNVYVQQVDNLSNTLIGCFVGLGICTSFSILFRFILTELLSKRYVLFVISMWCLFLAGQVSSVLNYLSQVDLVSLNSAIINFNDIVKDSSEIGHVLKSLLGYESSLTLTLILVYLFVFIIAFLLSKNYTYFSSDYFNQSTLSTSLKKSRLYE